MTEINLPRTSRQYVVRNASLEAGQAGFSSLVVENANIAANGHNEALVQIHAVSLNFRDIMVATGTYMRPVKDNVVPCSDGAGTVIAVGNKVTRVQVGDRVMATFHQPNKAGSAEREEPLTAIGAELDGMLREFAVFNEHGLVKVPSHLSWEEASTLPCAGVTAWNALMGNRVSMKAGDGIVTQGTGGVSLFAAQFAVVAGAEVVTTTSSASKVEAVQRLGVHHVINCNEVPEWGVEARKLLNGGNGADFVVEIGGPATIQQSLKAARLDGTVAVIGQRSGQAGGQAKLEMKLLDAFMYGCTMRRILLGSRNRFEEMIRSIAVNKIRPVVDQKVFEFDDAPKAFGYLLDQKHFGNVVIRVS